MSSRSAFSVFWGFFLSLSLWPMAPAPAASSATPLGPGLSYRQWECSVQDRSLSFEELRWEPGKGSELRALANPTAAPNPRCRHGYGGLDLPGLLRSEHAPRDFEVRGAVNGTLFREVRSRSGPGAERGYESNHLVWSKGAGLIAPLRRAGGGTLFVADSRGGREMRLEFASCRQGPCARVPGLSSQPLRTSELVSALQARFPTLSLALQSNMPLSGGKVSPGGAFTHYSQCPLDEAGRPRGRDWRCVPAARTLLCARRDGSVSLLTVPGAYPFELADRLRPEGACRAGCAWLYNLDGGGSTQLGYLAPGDGASAPEWRMSGSRMDTAEPGCSPYRPVDHYLAFGLARPSGPRAASPSSGGAKQNPRPSAVRIRRR